MKKGRVPEACDYLQLIQRTGWRLSLRCDDDDPGTVSDIQRVAIDPIHNVYPLNDGYIAQGSTHHASADGIFSGEDILHGDNAVWRWHRYRPNAVERNRPDQVAALATAALFFSFIFSLLLQCLADEMWSRSSLRSGWAHDLLYQLGALAIAISTAVSQTTVTIPPHRPPTRRADPGPGGHPFNEEVELEVGRKEDG